MKIKTKPKDYAKLGTWHQCLPLKLFSEHFRNWLKKIVTAKKWQVENSDLVKMCKMLCNHTKKYVIMEKSEDTSKHTILSETVCI